MKHRWLKHGLIALAATLALQTAVHGLTPPSASDGPVKLLSCVVAPTGVLEAQIDNQTDDAMECAVRCTYQISERQFSHTFYLSIPARFNGRLGRFDTSTGKAGNYPGDVGSCKKLSRL